MVALSTDLGCSESNASTADGSCPVRRRPTLWNWCSCTPPFRH